MPTEQRTERRRLLAALDTLCAKAAPEDDLSDQQPDAPEPVALVLQRAGVLFEDPAPLSPQRDDRLLTPPEMDLERDAVGPGLFPLIAGPDDLENGLQRTYCVREDAPWGPMALWQAPDFPVLEGPTVAAWFEAVVAERCWRRYGGSASTW